MEDHIKANEQLLEDITKSPMQKLQELTEQEIFEQGVQ